jgi:hypothetical protein
MLNSEINFGFMGEYKALFPNTSNPVDSTVVKDAVECTDEPTCFIYAAIYHNISTILNDLYKEMYGVWKNWTDENNRPLLCELEDGVVRTFDFALLFRKRSPFFEFINDITSHIVEGGIFLHIQKKYFEKEIIQRKFNFPASDENFPNSDDNFTVFGVSQLQTAFCLLMLGYVLAVACFVIEIVWHRYRSKGRERTSTSVCHRQP